jgi:hypothetical protein
VPFRTGPVVAKPDEEPPFTLGVTKSPGGLADDKQISDLSHCKPILEHPVLVAKEDKYSISAAT